jgi:hypothetical protein
VDRIRGAMTAIGPIPAVHPPPTNAISEHTVNFHVGPLLGKLSAATREEVVAIVLRRGLIML